MILNTGEYIHIIHRQLFPADGQRHFVGTVEGHEGPLVRVKGYLFAMDSTHSQFVRREPPRTRVVSLNDAFIVNVLPAHVQIDQITCTHRPNGDSAGHGSFRLTPGISPHVHWSTPTRSFFMERFCGSIARKTTLSVSSCSNG